MKKESEYRAHASECRTLAARTVREQDREVLLRMAADWERLATDRADLIRRHPELSDAGEPLEGESLTETAAGKRR